MTTSSRQTHADASDLPPLVELFLDAQRNQWDAWVRFQESLATFYKDLWEQWAVRFADAARIDD